MDRKTLLILGGAILLLFLLSPVVDHFFPPQPVPVSPVAAATNPPAATNGPAERNPSAETNLPAPTPAPAATPSPAATPEPPIPEQILTISNKDLVFHFTSRGGGLKSVALKDYPAVVSRSRKAPDENNFATLNAKAPVPVLAVLGEDARGDDAFTLTQSNTTVRAERTLGNGLLLIKEFEVGYTGTNYLFTATVRFQNPSAVALKIPRREVVVGTVTPIGPLDDPTTLGAMWYNGAKAVDIGAAWFANRTLGCIPGTPRSEFEDGASNVVWAAAHSQYFTFVAIPWQPAPSIVSRNVSLPPPDTNGVVAPNAMLLTNGIQTAFVYPAATLEPHKWLAQSFTFYSGPKEYNSLAKIGQNMGNNLDLVMGFTGFLGFGFFSKMLLLSMDGVHAILPSYGLCIIAITVIIRLVFWPMTAASTRSQKRLQALQPQLKAIAEKYKDDPLKKHEKTSAFMKEHKVNPMGSCLPMLIQIPVFFGFYSMLRNAIELRGIPFLWASDLTLPDTIATLSGFPINPLPLIMGVTQIWQSHLTRPPPAWIRASKNSCATCRSYSSPFFIACPPA